MLEYERIYFEVVIQTENGLYRRTVACWSTNGYTSKWLFRLKMGCIGGLWRVGVRTDILRSGYSD